MTKKGTALALFWVGLIWAFFWGIVASIDQAERYLSVLTLQELDQTIWSVKGPLMAVWGAGPPLGVLMAGIALLIYSGAKGWTTWLFGLGVFLAVGGSYAFGSLGHFSLLYAVGGSLILGFFFGVLWLWAKERMALDGRSAAAADLRLVGYTFMLIAAWFTCGVAGAGWHEIPLDQLPLKEPVNIIILFALGWLFLFLSHYKSRQLQDA